MRFCTNRSQLAIITFKIMLISQNKHWSKQLNDIKHIDIKMSELNATQVFVKYTTISIHNSEFFWYIWGKEAFKSNW